MLIVDNWQNTGTRAVIGYIRVWITRCSDYSSGFSSYRLESIGLKFWIQHLKLFQKRMGKISRKPCINGEYKVKISQLCYPVFFQEQLISEKL